MMEARFLSRVFAKTINKRFAKPAQFSTNSTCLWLSFRQRLAPINNFMYRRPVFTSIVVTTVKAWAADLVIQKAVENRETVDYRRSALFASFGCLYQGCVQYWIYNVLFEKKLFPGRSLSMVVRKIVATNLFVDPILFFPIFYTMREMLNTECLRDINVFSCFEKAIGKYSENFLDDWFNSWIVWVPAHCVTYSVIPAHVCFQN